MSDNNQTMRTVIIRVERFAPRPARERSRERAASPFAKTAAFGASRRSRGKQWTQEYAIAASSSTTVLDCLLAIKRDIDPTLAFRYSCGHGMCGSDAACINGTPTLLCSATIGNWAKPDDGTSDEEGFRKTGTPDPNTDHANGNDHSWGTVTLAPLPGFAVIRDLVVNIDPMLDQIRRLTPYLRADGRLATTSEGKVDVFEYLQHPDQLARYELLSNCIACGVCEGSCPVYAGGDAFIGPAALINASRFINDSRDTATDERRNAIDTADGIAACQSVRACSRECPRGIDVGEEIWQLITSIRQGDK